MLILQLFLAVRTLPARPLVPPHTRTAACILRGGQTGSFNQLKSFTVKIDTAIRAGSGTSLTIRPGVALDELEIAAVAGRDFVVGAGQRNKSGELNGRIFLVRVEQPADVETDEVEPVVDTVVVGAAN